MKEKTKQKIENAYRDGFWDGVKEGMKTALKTPNGARAILDDFDTYRARGEFVADSWVAFMHEMEKYGVYLSNRE